MGLAVILGLALALACALATNVAFLFKQRGAVWRRPCVPAPAAERRRPVRLEVVHVGMDRRGRGMAASRWRARARAAVDRAGRPLGWAGLPRRARRTLLRLPAGTPAMDRPAVTAAGLAVIGLTSGSQGGDLPGYALAALIILECTILGLATALTAVSTASASACGAGHAARRNRRRAVRRLRHRDQVPDSRGSGRGARADQPVDVCGARRFGDRLLSPRPAACSSARASR